MINYHVTIEPTSQGDYFRVTWNDAEDNKISAFEQRSEISVDDTLRLSRMAKFQLGIGQKLFRFLDGPSHEFRRALDRAHRKGEVLQLNLTACPGTHDWPFELLADKDFYSPAKFTLYDSIQPGAKKKPGFLTIAP